MLKNDKVQIIAALLALGLLGFASDPAAAAVRIEGQVQAGGGPLARSDVTLWAASAGEPKQLAQTRTRADGRFELRAKETPGRDAVLYLIAKGGETTVNKGSGDNPAIALLTVLGGKPPARVVVNEFTTVASVWTNAQFLDGVALQGHALGLRIAASSIGSNQSSKSMVPAATAAVFMVFFIMAWSPFRRFNAGISWGEHPGDYGNRISTTSATAPNWACF
jgi:hypothetical protein